MLRKVIALVAATFISNATHAIEVGDVAPNWTLPGSDGQTHNLADLRGQHVVVAWFPKAYTSG